MKVPVQSPAPVMLHPPGRRVEPTRVPRTGHPAPSLLLNFQTQPAFVKWFEWGPRWLITPTPQFCPQNLFVGPVHPTLVTVGKALSCSHRDGAPGELQLSPAGSPGRFSRACSRLPFCFETPQKWGSFFSQCFSFFENRSGRRGCVLACSLGNRSRGILNGNPNMKLPVSCRPDVETGSAETTRSLLRPSDAGLRRRDCETRHSSQTLWEAICKCRFHLEIP